MAVGTYEITHEKIMESGRTLFLQNGYERTNLRELCKEAGITTGAFYCHFEDKEALFAALVDPAIKGLQKRYDAAGDKCFYFVSVENISQNRRVCTTLHFCIACQFCSRVCSAGCYP